MREQFIRVYPYLMCAFGYNYRQSSHMKLLHGYNIHKVISPLDIYQFQLPFWHFIAFIGIVYLRVTEPVLHVLTVMKRSILSSIPQDTLQLRWVKVTCLLQTLWESHSPSLTWLGAIAAWVYKNWFKTIHILWTLFFHLLVQSSGSAHRVNLTFTLQKLQNANI